MRRAEVEMLWVNAWNDVYDIIEGRKDYPCVLPDFSCVSVDECLAWLQRSAYEGFDLEVSRRWWKGRPAVVANRWPRRAQ
jgi:hypothetical protein